MKNKRAATNFLICIIVAYAFIVPIMEKPFHPFFNENNSKLQLILKDDIFDSRSLPFYPFSSYLMYSNVLQDPKMYYLDIRGIQGREEIFMPIYTYFFPYWRRALLEAYQAHLIRGKSSQDFFRGVWDHYNKNKKKYNLTSNDTGAWPRKIFPDIDGIKVYAVTWSWETWVAYRKSVPDLGNHYDYLESDYKPLKRELLEVVR